MGTVKQIWLLSHDDKFEVINQIKQTMQAQGSKTLCFLTKNLRIEDSGQNFEQKLVEFKQSYTNKFGFDTDLKIKQGIYMEVNTTFIQC